MPFVQRDARGSIISLLKEPTRDASEYLKSDDPEVREFFEQSEAFATDPLTQRKHELTETDFALIRAIEDMIEVLLRKGLVRDAELPPQLMNLIERRRSLRRLLQDLMSSGMTGTL